MRKEVAVLGALAGVLALVAGCSVDPAGEAPETDVDEIDEQQVVTVTVNGVQWTMDALQPTAAPGNIARASMTLSSSTSGVKTAAGVCLLTKVKTPEYPTGKICTKVDECSNFTPPTGGYRYCTAPDTQVTKYCHVRLGPASAWCAGTPAIGAPVSAGTHTTPWSPALPGGTELISYGCFSGCAASDPSSSSVLRILAN